MGDHPQAASGGISASAAIHTGRPPIGWRTAVPGGIYLLAVIVSGLIVPFGPAALLLIVAIVPVAMVCRWDSVSALTLLLLVVFGISARYTLGVGPPVMFAGLFCLGVWLVATLTDRRPAPRSPVRAATLLLIWFLLLGYAVAFTRVLTTLEVSNGQRQTLIMIAAAGVTLLAADRISDRQRLDVLLRRLVLGVTFVSAIAIVQYLFDRDLSMYFVPPGLHQDAAAAAILERSNLRRVAGTAGHPIEFGVLLAMVLPLALHFAMSSSPGRSRQWAWLQVALIGIGLPLSISRSAVLSLAVALIVMMAGWDNRRRLNFGASLLLFTAFFNVAVPGVLGTIKALFLWANEDPSVAGRTEDYPLVWHMIAQRPVLGRGLGTFVPGQYFFLDNQFLGTIIEIGYLGLAVVVLWLVVGLACARGARRRAVDPVDRQLGQAIVAGILAAVASCATFDTFGYRQVTFTLFLLVGCAGALWRLTAADRGVYARETGATSGSPAEADDTRGVPVAVNGS
ncbi:O-antigen ligase family protein [Pseudofrankia sp. BMG5.37]|uniref:O-antigen ligase family protein n=1 Tax=Pseudofrankia sp. BMG5.37 TaxID=3050035 RepID=UPI00289614B0|nr:O-antigen ligase family protein [Pseudofrankia sp. BMG5.37]MDT3443505.1 O-antigen ligase family protein [Pseudofrankia sp. BMG5.37]